MKGPFLLNGVTVGEPRLPDESPPMIPMPPAERHIAETADYAIRKLLLKNDNMIDGQQMVYVTFHKVHEIIADTNQVLANAIMSMQACQEALDKVTGRNQPKQ